MFKHSSPELFVNFCPRKWLWEMQQVKGDRFSSSSVWWKYGKELKHALQLLQRHGVKGLRLNIFSFELLNELAEPKWYRVAGFLALCTSLHLKVDCCLGPFQYPLWPGIRLPQHLHKTLLLPNLDDNPVVADFGMWWVEQQMTFLNKYSCVTGFYVGNEYHDAQAIEDVADQNKYHVSKSYMFKLIQVVRSHTSKPILLNTNIDVSHGSELHQAFDTLLAIPNVHLGIDVYPSRETWTNAFELRLRRLSVPFALDVQSGKKDGLAIQLFSEFEAQPWAAGESWVQWWNKLENRQTFTEKIFARWLQNNVFSSKLPKVTMWGAEFWLVSAELQHTWILDTIEQYFA